MGGDSYLRGVFDRYGRGKQRDLVHKVIHEFDPRPSGLVLPDGLVAKRVEGSRITRIAWKIVRGLYFFHHQVALSEDAPHSLRVVPPDECPPEEFFHLPDLPIHGQYPEIFDYKYAVFPDAMQLNIWALLLWNKIILLVYFHDPQCSCDKCTDVTPFSIK